MLENLVPAPSATRVQYRVPARVAACAAHRAGTQCAMRCATTCGGIMNDAVLVCIRKCAYGQVGTEQSFFGHHFFAKTFLCNLKFYMWTQDSTFAPFCARTALSPVKEYHKRCILYSLLLPVFSEHHQLGDSSKCLIQCFHHLQHSPQTESTSSLGINRKHFVIGHCARFFQPIFVI